MKKNLKKAKSMFNLCILNQSQWYKNKWKSPNIGYNQLKIIATLQNQIVYENYKWQVHIVKIYIYI
jgi:hypothetical protein